MTVRIALAALVRHGKVLLAHRHPARRAYPDCWDLVGGHVEEGESPEQAVRRECREEIGVDLLRLRPVELRRTDPGLVADAFLVTDWVGSPTNVAPDEHDALAWFTAADLHALVLADPCYRSWLPPLLVPSEPSTS